MRWILLCLWVLVVSSAGFAEDIGVGTIKNVENNIIVLRKGVSIKVTPGFKVFQEDIILSNVGSTAGIIFNDSTSVTLGEKSEMIIAEYLFQPKEKTYSFKMHLKSGSAIYSSGKMGKLSPESIKFKTPKATVGVRGTKFLVKVD